MSNFRCTSRGGVGATRLLDARKLACALAVCALALTPALVRADLASERIGAPPGVGFSKVVHRHPRLSRQNAFSEEEVRDFCRGRIANYKVPHYVKFVDEYPMTASGKIQKFKLREMAKAG